MPVLVVIIAVASFFTLSTGDEACKSLEASLDPLLRGPDGVGSYTMRRVELGSGTDSVSCLNSDREPKPSPCRTIEYALQPTSNVEVIV